MKMHRRARRKSWAALAVIPAMLLAACGSSGTSDSDSDAASTGDETSIEGTPTEGGTLTVGSSAATCSFVPTLCTVSFSGSLVMTATLDYLVQPDESVQGWTPSLATSVTPNEDFTEWTAELSDAKYSDGSPFAAQDVVTEFEQYALAPTSTLRGDLGAVQAVAAPDSSTVVFTLNAPSTRFPNVLTSVPLFKPGPTDKTDIPVGTGPFMIASWTPGVEVVLERNPHYWRKDADGAQLPYLDRLVVKPIVSPDTRLASLETSGISMALVDDPITLAQARDISGVEVVSTVADAGRGWFMNTAAAPTDDLRVRQAVAYATDREALLAAVGGVGAVRDQYFDPSSPVFSSEASEAAPHFDLDRAKVLVEEYVQDPNRSDGKAPGSPIAIMLNYVNGSVTQQSLVQVAQQQWSQAGIDVSVEPKDEATLIGDVISGNYHITYFEWAVRDPYALFVHNYSPFPPNIKNFTKFNSDEMQEAIARMAVASSESEFKSAVADASDIIATQVPIIPFQSTVLSFAARTDEVVNLHVTGSGMPDFARLSTVAG